MKKIKVLIGTFSALSILLVCGINNSYSTNTKSSNSISNVLTHAHGDDSGFKIPSDATSSGTIGTSPYYIEGTTLYLGSGDIDTQEFHDVLTKAGNITKIDGSLATNLTSDYGLFSKFKTGEWKIQDLITSINLPNYTLPSDSSLSFQSLQNLTYLNTENWNTSQVTSMLEMFASDSKLTSLDVSKFNTSNVTNMSNVFNNDSELTSLDVSKWNTSNVTDMGYLFSNLSSLTSLDVSKWNTSNVTNMKDMFDNASRLASLDLSNFNTSKVTNMSHMFQSTSKLKNLNISNFNTSKVTDMSDMFSLSNLSSLDVSNFDTSNVTNMKDMFYELPVLSLNISNFNTSKVTNMSNMFYGEIDLTSLDVSNFDTSNVTNMSYMFGDNQELTSLNVNNFNTSKVTDMSYMFNNDSMLTSLDLSDFTLNNTMTYTDFISGMSSLNKLILGKNIYLSNSNFTNISSPWQEQESKTNYNSINDVFADKREETKTYIIPLTKPYFISNTDANFKVHPLTKTGFIIGVTQQQFSFNLGSYDSATLSVNMSELTGNNTNQKLSGTASMRLTPAISTNKSVSVILGSNSDVELGSIDSDSNNDVFKNSIIAKFTNAKYADTYSGTINYSISVTP